MEDIRQCNKCGYRMAAGYVCCDEYFCSRECLDESFAGSGTSWAEHYEDDGDCCWTTWSETSEVTSGTA